MKKCLSIIALTALFFLACGQVARADGFIIPIPRPDQPVPPLRSLAIKYHRVTVTIDNQVATTHVDQVFVNDSSQDLEGQYIFPLPEEASISQFAMWVDGSRLEAEVLPRDKARQVYEDIVRQQRDPALLEYVGRNAFRARVYPIPARGEKRIELEYSEVLPLDQGLVRYIYPLNTEKFSSRPLEEVRVAVSIASRQPLKAVYSPSHDVVVRKESDAKATVEYRAQNVRPDKDFVLYYTVGADDLGVNLLSYREGDDKGFFLLLVAPRTEVQEQTLVAQDVFFVLDTSGSMRGTKLTQAKRAAQYVLDNLNANDRFNVIAFNTSTSLYATGLRPASEAARARAFVDNLESSASTNIGRAFEETLAQATKQRPQVVIFLTDGLPTEGETNTDKLLDKVDKLAGDNVRLFVFGVGNDVNTTLLDVLAQRHHGTTVYVRPEEDIERAVSALYEKISKPVLTDIALDFGNVRVEDTYPYPLPDVFAGGQLVVVGRYLNSDNTTLTLRGTAGGKPATYTFSDLRFRQSGGAEFIPRLWATRKIGYLLNQIRLHGSDKELVDEIVALSVRYGIVTPYTSFLVNEQEDALTSEGRARIVEKERSAAPAPALAPPAGSSGSRIPAPTAAASGAKAVEKSVAEQTLRSADVAAAPQSAQVRIVGDRTFVLRGEVWTDTTYDASKLEPERVAFGSERYFQLLAQHPDWGRYLALGAQVILVFEGRAYHIGASGDALAQATPARATPTASPTSVRGATVTPGQPRPAATNTPALGIPPSATPWPAPSATPTTLNLWDRIGIWFRGLFKR